MVPHVVELHVVSDSTGETAARLVSALEAQFPDQPFAEIRHPRVEDAEDLARAVNRAKGQPAVILYTLVKPEWRDAMRALFRSARVHNCDLLGQPFDSVRRVSGMNNQMTVRPRAAIPASPVKAVLLPNVSLM